MKYLGFFWLIVFFVLLVSGLCSVVYSLGSYNLSISVNASDNFTLGESNQYKVIVKNNETADETINITISREIFGNGSVVFFNSGNYSLKKSLTKTFRWTPDFAGEYVLCANITRVSVNDSDLSNNQQCRNISVGELNVSNDEFGVNASNIMCDLEVVVDHKRFFYNSSEALGIKIIVSDLNHSGIMHPFVLAYWIEDLFGNVVKPRYENSYEINAGEIRSYNPRAASISDSEAYLIKAEIVDAGCNDTDFGNNHNESMFLVRGLRGNATEDGGESYVRITKISPGETNFGDNIDVSIDAFRGDTSKYSLNVWIERPSDGFDVSLKSTVHLKDKNREYTLKIPVQIKPNCNGRYKDGSYDVIVEAFGAEDTERIRLAGLSSSLCKVETKTVKKYVTKKETEDVMKSNADDGPGVDEKESKIPDVEYRIISAEDAVVFGEPFLSVVEVKNNRPSALNISVYGYVISGRSRLSEGLSILGWKKSWTGNKVELLVDSGEEVRVNLTNRVMKNITGNFTFKVKIKGDIDRVVERDISVNAPIVVVDMLDVSCNATGGKTYLFIRNNGGVDEEVFVITHGSVETRRAVMVKMMGVKTLVYVGRVDEFDVGYGDESVVCSVEYDDDDDLREDRDMRRRDDNRITLQQTSVSMKRSLLDRIFERIMLFFG